jgi:hypothetical protein
MRYIIRKGTVEHDALTQTGLSHLLPETKSTLITRLLLDKL